MGKIKKIKAERKKARIEAEVKSKKRNLFLAKILLAGLLFFIISGISVFIYRTADAKWNISDKFEGVILSTTNRHEKKNNTQDIDKQKVYTEPPTMKIDTNKEYITSLKTNKGNFKIKLLAKDAPKTVNNFVFLSRDGFYDGLTFHRVVRDFMIQGGDPSGDGTGGPGYKFEDENLSTDYEVGVVAMANSGPNTNGSQFFIMTSDYSDGKLPAEYSVFGRVIEGLEVIMKIGETETDESDKPTSPVIIEKISVFES